MTISSILGVLIRRWYVMLVVLGATGALAAFEVAHADGVYATRTIVSFLYRYESSLSLDGSVEDDDVIAFAGAVAAEIVPGRDAVRYAAGDAPYYGAGLRQGMLVGLVDYGNQWTPSYGVAAIEIQIVGESEAWVADRQGEALERIMHSPYVTGQPGDITDLVPRVDPLSLQIQHIAPSHTAQVAAVAAMATAGVFAAGALAVGVDRLAHRATADESSPKERR